MASVFKRSYRDPKTSRKRKTRKYYGKYRDSHGIVQRVPLATNKTAAQRMLNELIEKAEKEQAGLVDPYEEHRKRPLHEHLEAYRRHLEGKTIPSGMSARRLVSCRP